MKQLYALLFCLQLIACSLSAQINSPVITGSSGKSGTSGGGGGGDGTGPWEINSGNITEKDTTKPVVIGSLVNQAGAGAGLTIDGGLYQQFTLAPATYTLDNNANQGEFRILVVDTSSAETAFNVGNGHVNYQVLDANAYGFVSEVNDKKYHIKCMSSSGTNHLLYSSVANARVGIGSIAPQAKLHVIETGNVSVGKFENTNDAAFVEIVSVDSAAVLSVTSGIYSSNFGINNSKNTVVTDGLQNTVIQIDTNGAIGINAPPDINVAKTYINGSLLVEVGNGVDTFTTLNAQKDVVLISQESGSAYASVSLGDGVYLSSSGFVQVSAPVLRTELPGTDLGTVTVPFDSAYFNFINTEVLEADELHMDVASSNVSNPPTDAQLDALFGTPAAVGNGFVRYLKDSDSNNTYQVIAVGAQWYSFSATLAP